MYHFITYILIASLSIVLAACQQQHTIRPKKRPQTKKIVTKQERSQSIKHLPAPERRKVEHTHARQHEEQLTHLGRPIKELTYEELKVTKDALLAEEDLLGTLKYLERMLVVSTDLNELKDLRLDVADLNFDLGNLEKAETYYNDYISFYPGSDLIEYVTYKSILSCFYQTLESDRDQSKTQQSIKLANDFLKNESYKTYAEDVKNIQQVCTSKAFEGELHVFNFYLSQNKIKAAQQRLSYIKEHYPIIDQNMQVSILTAEVELAQSEGNTELYNLKQQELNTLTTQLPTTTPTNSISDLAPKKKNYANRF